MYLPENLSDLPLSMQRLLALVQSVGFGQIRDVRLVDGEVCLDPPPRVVREIKFPEQPRKSITSSDYVLKRQSAELAKRLIDLRDGVVTAIEVKDGLPFRLVLEE